MMRLSDVSATSLHDVHKRRDYFSHGDMLDRFEGNDSVEYRHANVLFDAGAWQGYRWQALGHQDSSPKVLVIGHSDLVITRETVQRIRQTLPNAQIFATNLSEEASSIEQTYDLPLGIPNRDNSTPIHRVQSSRMIIRLGWESARRTSSRHFRGVYLNFSPRNNINERAPILEIAQHYGHLHVGDFQPSHKGRLRDFRNIGYWGINVCPQGNGPDTHRVWETLLMGAFPVILRASHVHRILKALRLPCIALDEWAQLGDVNSLSREFSILCEQEWGFSPLTNSFWVRRISASA